MTDFRAQLEAQQAIQDLIAWHAPLDTILPAVCRMLERQFSGAKCTVMLQDPGSETISLVAGDTLSQAFFDAMQRIPVVDDMGTCGTAACRNDTVISEDIQQDPRWESAHELARAEGVCACLSTPVQTRDGRVAGTFAVYFDRPKAPSAEEVDAVQRFSALVSLALERDRDHRTIAESEQLYQSLFTQHPDAVYALDLDGHELSSKVVYGRD